MKNKGDNGKAVKKRRGNAKKWATPFAGMAGGDRPLWRHFWLVLFVGAVLRLTAAITGDWLMRTDELFQYLEQSHRMVFGYGSIPWEFRFGMRTYALPALSAAPLYLAKFVGWDSPDFYAPLVRSFHALLSLAVPAGMYFFARRVHGESAARFALVFGCLWHELIVIAPHPVAENTAMTCIFAALIFVSPKAGTFARIAVGFLLAAAFMFRNPYAPPIALAGLLLLLPFSWSSLFRRGNLAMFGAGIFAVVLAGYVDYLTWGGWWQSYINYFELQSSGYGDFTYTPPRTTHVKSLLVASAGLFYVAALFALPFIRKLWLPGLMFLLVQIPHNMIASAEYTNTILGVPFILVVAACVVAQWLIPATKKPGRDEDVAIIPPQKKAAGLSAGLLLVSALAFGGYLPGQTHMYVFKNERPLFHQSGFFAVNKVFSQMPPGEVKSIVFLIPGVSAHLFGGYYYTHQNAPMWFPFTEDYARDALGLTAEEMADAQTLLITAGERFATKASHLVMPVGVPVEGFSPVYESAPIAIFGNTQIAVWQNDNPGGIKIPDGAVYDIMDNAIVQVLGLLDSRLGIISQEQTPLTPFSP